PAVSQPRAATDRVNPGLTFDLEGLRGFVVETSEALGESLTRRARLTYRVIETVGSAPPRIERYLETETTRRTQPFGTSETVRRERVRSLVASDGLRPISSRGEVSWWTDGGWRHAQHDVRFEGDRVVGVVTDSTGRGLELDR